MDEHYINPSAMFDLVLGMDGDTPVLSVFRRTIPTNYLYFGSVAGLLFCENSTMCISQSDIKVSAGPIFGDFTETSMSYLMETSRSIDFFTAYDFSFPSVPKYTAFGLTNLDHDGSLAEFSMTTNFYNNAIKSTVSVQPYQRMKLASGQYLVSDWGKIHI